MTAFVFGVTCLLLVTGCVLTVRAQACADTDSAACAALERSDLNLCSDPFITNHTCPRYCGKCPKQCYACPDLVKDISLCNLTVECAASESCYTMEVYDFDTSHGFRGGCLAKDICGAHAASQSVLGKRKDSHVQLHCCEDDLCNGKAASSFVPGPTTVTTTTQPSTCVDVAPNCGYNYCYHPSLKYQCLKTCKMCSQPQVFTALITKPTWYHVTCRDFMTNCDQSHCHLLSFRHYCPLTCGDCVNVAPTSPIVWRPTDHCVDHNSNCDKSLCGDLYYNQVCSRTCGYCG